MKKDINKSSIYGSFCRAAFTRLFKQSNVAIAERQWLIVAPRKCDVLKTNIFLRRGQLLADSSGT